MLLCVFAFSACADEKIVQDAQNGIWQYETENLKIEITKHSLEKPLLVWFEVHIWASEENPFIAVLSDYEKPGSWFRNPIWLASTRQYVFAINDDFFGHRLNMNEVIGAVVRNGQVIGTRTHRNSNHALPNLDTMTLYPEGRMEVNDCAELTVDEMMEKGAEHVFSFGPVVIKDGQMNEKLIKYYRNNEPRVVFGFVEPYHYVVLVAEGRHNRSNGTGLQWVAEKMLEMGAVQALNLDGGQTSALIFMGEKLNKTGNYEGASNMRNVSSMIAFGQSESVPPYDK